MSADFDEVFRKALGLADDTDLSTVAYGETAEWDSVGHLELVLALEDAYGISIDGADVLETADYQRLKTLLRERYEVALDA